MRVYVNYDAAKARDTDREKTQAIATADGFTMAQILENVKRSADVLAAADASSSLYTDHLRNRISGIEINPSQDYTSLFVEISDEGLTAMAQEPDYEDWVIDTLEYDFSFEDLWGGVGSHKKVTHTFGPSRRDYLLRITSGSGTTDRNGQEKEETCSKDLTGRLIWKRPAIRITKTVGSDPYAQLRARLRIERLMRRMALERQHLQTEMFEYIGLRRRDMEEMHRTGRDMPETSAPLPRIAPSPTTLIPVRYM